MDRERFANSPVGHVVEIDVPFKDEIMRTAAFIPDPLPDDFQLSNRTWNAIIEAARQIGSLDSLARGSLTDPTLIAGITLRREALSTSALEGTYAPALDVLRSEVTPDDDVSEAVTEVRNFITAAHHGVEQLESLPVCTRLACDLQGVLIEGTKSDNHRRGKIRDTPVVIGLKAGAPPFEARFVPPPHGDLLQQGMDAWEKWLHREDEIHPLVRIAATHYQFETLHPFTDGNGRIGRLLAVLQLIESRLLHAPVINLSPYFEERKAEYFGALEEVSAGGDWDQWISLLCNALESQARDSGRRIRRLLDWQDLTVAQLRAQGVSGAALRLLPELVGKPVVTAPAIAEMLEVSAPTAYKVLQRLEGHGVVQALDDTKYRREYQVPAVLEIMFDRPL